MGSVPHYNVLCEVTAERGERAMSRFDLRVHGLVRIAAASAWMALLWRRDGGRPGPIAGGRQQGPAAGRCGCPEGPAVSPRGTAKECLGLGPDAGRYDGQSWLDKARSFRIRSEENITWTKESVAGGNSNRFQGRSVQAMGGPHQFSVRIEWAWDEQRVRRTHAVVHPGETLFSRDTRIWDGSLAVAYNALPDRKLKQYTLGNKVSRLFNEIIVRDTIEIPWAPGGPHDFWWLPKDVEGSRTMRYLAPEDFETGGTGGRSTGGHAASSCRGPDIIGCTSA